MATIIEESIKNISNHSSSPLHTFQPITAHIPVLTAVATAPTATVIINSNGSPAAVVQSVTTATAAATQVPMHTTS